ncbi:T9SS type A sorting domain-containing protein [bacterium SCSIO 12643]|nr:T9SS type A sorting domain-containing protein [bacterium SCSIO 12643]
MDFKYILFFCLLPFGTLGQEVISFDDTSNLDLIIIDTLSNPNNIWQIGKPQKGSFNSAYSDPNVMVTDTINPYPINDTSVFYLWYTEHKEPGWWPTLEFKFKTDTDSLNDYGEIQFSPDKGSTWFKVEDNNPGISVNCNCNRNNPFTGRNLHWTDMFIGFGNWDDNYGYTDSILFKFIFYSDNIPDVKDGWIIDDIKMYDYISNIVEKNIELKININPNPAQETIRIQFLDPNIRDAQELKIYSITGQLVIHQMINPPKSEINIETLEPGVYMYTIGDQRGKMVVE